MSITLFCLVKGNTAANAFAVDIDSEKAVSHLKDAIKAKKAPVFDNFPSDELKLWKVEISRDNGDQLKYLSLKDSDELLAINEIGDYWSEKPPKRHIHILVEPPVSTATSSREQELLGRIASLETLIKSTVRKNIKDEFFGGLPYMKPEPLLRTSGANWEYQPDPSLKQILRKALRTHYKNFTLGLTSDLSVYFFLSGAGTGKSRNANEFHQTAITCLSAQEDGELLTKIKEAWVFHVSYENEFSLRREEHDPYLAIGTRMLFQLLREKMDLDKVIEKYKSPDPMAVVKLIAKQYNRDLKSATVILIVDGMQQLMKNKDDRLNINSTFYRTLTSIADLAFSGTFLIPVCTSAIAKPINGTFGRSIRYQVHLPVASLQPPNDQQGVPVFKNDKVTNTVLEDCGGHGRALEVLNDCLAGRSIEECNVDALMNDLRYRLTIKYRNAIFGSMAEARPIARAILTKRRLNRYKPIPKTDKTPDELVEGGLFRFEHIVGSPVGYLTAPYIWFWMLSQKIGDPILWGWKFDDYGEQRALLNPATSLQAKSWQSFEKFVASFRCIKSAVIEEDELTAISEVHAGARLNGNIQFKNHNLQLEITKHITDTRSKTLTASEWNVDCSNSTVDVRKFKHCIINAPTSPHGDSFLSLDQPGTESPNDQIAKKSSQ